MKCRSRLSINWVSPLSMGDWVEDLRSLLSSTVSADWTITAKKRWSFIQLPNRDSKWFRTLITHTVKPNNHYHLTWILYLYKEQDWTDQGSSLLKEEPQERFVPLEYCPQSALSPTESGTWNCRRPAPRAASYPQTANNSSNELVFLL